MDPAQEEDLAPNGTRCQALPPFPDFMLALQALGEFRCFPATLSFVKSGEIIRGRLDLLENQISLEINSTWKEQ